MGAKHRRYVPKGSEHILCLESQEYTYAWDNTGTNYRWPDATYEIALSDGNTLTYKQTAASNGGWTQQLTDWTNGPNPDSIQSVADAAGLLWFVEPRFVDNSNPSNIDGTINGPGGTASGLPGAPSSDIALQLVDAGMAWRYVNVQVCPGQPVPVGVRLVSVDDDGGFAVPALPFDLTATPRAILGPINEFRVCETCDKDGIEQDWYIKERDVNAIPAGHVGPYFRAATPGEIPNCYFPCGAIASLPSPPEADCQFVFEIGCDSEDPVDPDRQITRRAKFCGGEKVEVVYFVEDPADPSALVLANDDGTIVGSFVDCDSGEEIPDPVPEPEKERITSREVCLDVDGVILNAFAIICETETGSTLIRYEDGSGNVVTGTIVNCTCDAVDVLPSIGIGDPIGDQTICATRKLGADFVSNAAGEGSHVAGSLFDTNGPVTAWVGTFTVTDSAGATHTFTDGQTVTGMASGGTQGVTFTGQVEWTDGTDVYRCPVTDKAISANFTVQ